MLTVTVENPEMVLATAVFERILMKIAVAWAGLSLFDCHQAVKNVKNCSVIESF